MNTFFAHKSTGSRQKLTGKNLAHKWPGILLRLWLSDVSPVKNSHKHFRIDKGNDLKGRFLIFQKNDFLMRYRPFCVKKKWFLNRIYLYYFIYLKYVRGTKVQLKNNVLSTAVPGIGMFGMKLTSCLLTL